MIIVIRRLTSDHTFLTAPVQERCSSPEQGEKTDSSYDKAKLMLADVMS